MRWGLALFLLAACAAPEPKAGYGPGFACGWFIATQMPRDAELIDVYCPPEKAN